MKMNLRWLTVIVTSLLNAFALASVATAFSREGHESIALLAYSSKDLLPAAKSAIDRILGSETIEFAAEWPDAIKPPFGAAANTPDAVDFIHEHPSHSHWHFVNFPIESTAYSLTSPYARPDDISHAIQGCISVLEGKGAFDNLNKKEALRYLVHLVGDAHQPLHTTFEQFDVSKPSQPMMLPATTLTPAGALMDGGGNALYYDPKNELHALWDDDLVSAIVGSNKTEKLVAALRQEVSKKYDPTTGDYHKWADLWLGESMQLVTTVFAGIKYNSYREEGLASTHITKKIYITLPATYQADNVKIARTQVVRGASHLLQLFNAIKWSRISNNIAAESLQPRKDAFVEALDDSTHPTTPDVAADIPSSLVNESLRHTVEATEPIEPSLKFLGNIAPLLFTGFILTAFLSKFSAALSRLNEYLSNSGSLLEKSETWRDYL